MRQASEIRVLAPLLLAAATGLSCSGAARAFLDLPPPEPQTTALAPAQETPVREWVPAPIESVADSDSVLALLPRDAAGYVDWSEAVRAGVIRPRWAVESEASETGGQFGYDFYLEGENVMFDAFFPHSSHTRWLDCASCHPLLYKYRGQVEITMAEINEGRSCGTCHGPVAFPAANCERCHTNMTMPANRAEASFPPEIVLSRQQADESGVTQEARESFPMAVFAHSSHRIRYSCSACHPALFAMEAGSTRVTMSEMSDGIACGACHQDQGAAFAMVQCNRCHYELEEAAEATDR